MPQIRTKVLDVAYEAGGPPAGRPVLLIHGWPDSTRGWRGITPRLERAGVRWIAPSLRGFGETRFLSADTVRDGSGVALAQDAIDLADALGLDRFAVVGHDWGARAAHILAALFPERLTSIATLGLGYSPGGAFPTPSFAQSRRWWYQWFMATDRGAEAVAEDPKGFARIQWETWSPGGWFDDAEFDATAQAFDNPDFVAVTLNAYRGRWKVEPADERCAPLRERLRSVETLSTPALMIQGGADACNPPGESEGQERLCSGGYARIVLDGVGHFPAREAPGAVAEALITHLGHHTPGMSL
jgi:pimeloyl-ACP methyl ester carboxylesterase